MSVLQVIRHGQASFFKDDYDVLSPLGEEQGRVLGRHWAANGHRPDRVYMGPRRRHRETAEAVAGVFHAEGLDWPRPEVLDELDEHCGQSLVERELPLRIERDPSLAELAERPPRDPRLFFRFFREVTRAWVREELPTPEDLEDWATFRRRVTRGLERVLASAGHGETIAVFTSGGPVAVVTGMALELAGEKVLELSWRVRNTASAELLVSDEGVTLNAFNTIEHLTEPRLVTYV